MRCIFYAYIIYGTFLVQFLMVLYYLKIQICIIIFSPARYVFFVTFFSFNVFIFDWCNYFRCKSIMRCIFYAYIIYLIFLVQFLMLTGAILLKKFTFVLLFSHQHVMCFCDIFLLQRVYI